MNKKLFITGAILGALTIVLGAFGAHGLENLLPPEAIETYKTGVRYQMYGAFFLILVGLVPISRKMQALCFYFMLIGVVLFSGSIYLLATNTLTTFNFKSIALATPLGGLFMILAWIIFMVSAVKLKKR